MYGIAKVDEEEEGQVIIMGAAGSLSVCLLALHHHHYRHRCENSLLRRRIRWERGSILFQWSNFLKSKIVDKCDVTSSRQRARAGWVHLPARWWWWYGRRLTFFLSEVLNSGKVLLPSRLHLNLVCYKLGSRMICKVRIRGSFELPLAFQINFS